MTTTQSGSYPQTSTEPGVINLGLGQPSPSLLPLPLLHAAAMRRLGPDADPLLLQYGSIPGYLEFREALAELLGRRYRVPVDATELCVTGGISSALSWVAERLGPRTGAVVCSDPTYFLARGIFEDQGREVVGIEVDEGGLVVDRLQARLAAGLRPAFVYCMPSFHNPRGVHLEPARARLLVDLAERYDFFVVADEPYVMLGFADEPPPCMMSYDQGRGRVVSLGSFSKILGPGLRLGWVHTAVPTLERCTGHGILRSGGALNPVVSAIVHGVIETGDLDRHIDHLRRTFRTRADALTQALRHELPLLEVPEPMGGYFLWLELPKGRDVRHLHEQAPAHGVSFTPGPRCAIERDLSRCLRLSFAFYEPDELRTGASRLGALVRAAG
ncbi:MAG: PLP-dependent aminotransferase family protein [Nannocystaceae bacterium]